MDAKELRIGSYYSTGIEVRGSREAQLHLMKDRVIELTLDHFMILSKEPSWLPLINAIPLTEEWLVKLGFVKRDKVYKFPSVPILHLSKWESNIFLLTDSRGKEILSLIPLIKYVHQLQNIYFALTGEELDIK
jgi:hypothetical protein